ncbi:MAG: hypothetical protein MJ204_05750 [Bacteroidales bacterium]|nr:hypothetical protein [Bacteroidales bacterium]
METLFRILEITIPSVIVFLVSYCMIKRLFEAQEKKQQENSNSLIEAFLKNEEQKRNTMQKAETQKISLPLRIQAYERLVLLLERISPESLLLRVQTPQMTAAQLHQELLITVRAEFEHNLSQQIYVSQQAWVAVKLAKDSLVKTINESAGKIAVVAPATALSEEIIKEFMAQQVNPIAVALGVLKQDAENYM